MTGLRKAHPTDMTRAEFIAWMTRNRVCVYVYPFDVVPCSCRDYNCHGWRLVASAPVRPVRTMLSREVRP